jgi:hypothetical protein
MHKADAQRFFENRSDVDVTYAAHYYESYGLLFDNHEETRSIDGVISDICFPMSDYKNMVHPVPAGVMVAVKLSQVGVPFVLNTSGYHHGKKYEWIHQLAKDQGWTVVESGSIENPDGESGPKNWERAYELLSEKMK